MAKIRCERLTYQPYFTQSFHFGGLAREDPHCWHAIYAYDWSHLPWPTSGAWFYPHWTLDESLLHARSLVALPVIVRDACPYCWGFDMFFNWTVLAPRWNIYRGQTRIITPPCIFHDVRTLVPPPGFDYD